MTAQFRPAVSFLIPALIALLAGQHAGPRVPSGRTPPEGGELTRLDAGGARQGPALDPAARQAGADKSWLQNVTAQIAIEEYQASSNAAGLQAPNRAHNLRTYFRARGIEIAPRQGSAAPAWRFAWETSRFGRPGALRAVGASTPDPHASRVNYRRPEFKEWYENSREGVEQGFIVYASPPGEGPLCLAGRLAGSLRAELRADAGAVEFVDEHGARVLRYGELHVWDAGGDEVPSRLSLDGAELAILVEDDGAAYPLTVDPLMTSPA